MPIIVTIACTMSLSDLCCLLLSLYALSLLYQFLFMTLCGRYFLYLVLDKVVCPFLVKYFEMPIWHPTSEKTLNKLLDAKVDL